jgi:CIC family chloride channel protein
LWRGPDWLRPAAGGILLGLLLLVVPQMYGVGYPVLERAVAGHYVIFALLGLLTAKVLATSLTMWIGGSGGVFAPSLFMGAMLGSAYGAIAHDALPHVAAAAGAYGLVGMGAVFAAAARAPITAVLIIFELTGDYRVILPLMIAVVIATTVASAATRDTIYTLKLRRRGVNIDASAPSGLMARITVAEALGELPRPLSPDLPVPEILDRFVAERTNALPVISGDGSLLGVVSAGDVEQALANPQGAANAHDLIHETPELRIDQTLQDAVWRLGATDDDGLPVLDERGDHVVGWLTHRRLLGAYRKRLGERDPPPARDSQDGSRGPP